MEKKITKRENFESVLEILNNSNVEYKEELINFVTKEIEILDAKAEKAKERAAVRKAEGDALRVAVQAVLTEELQTIDAILSQVEGEELTKAKITARLTSLVNENIAVREEIKTEDGKKVKAYKLA